MTGNIASVREMIVNNIKWFVEGQVSQLVAFGLNVFIMNTYWPKKFPRIAMGVQTICLTYLKAKTQV